MILLGGSSHYTVRDSVYGGRKFCGCPACAFSADVSVRKCLETLRRIGLLERHGLSETPIVWRNTSLWFARIKDSRERSKAVFDQPLPRV